jgi:hypothetical protein
MREDLNLQGRHKSNTSLLGRLGIKGIGLSHVFGVMYLNFLLIYKIFYARLATAKQLLQSLRARRKNVPVNELS